jgi:ATP-dependent RNA circularization protein (DNA/RNA ligase family)
MKKILIISLIFILSSIFIIDINNILNKRVSMMNPYIHKKYNNIEIINYNIFDMSFKLANGKYVDYSLVIKSK